uniref:Uncharacterized protein n=1 Tax=virus sp. ctrcb4 TaxID=2825824 RepID=A0A8S5RQ25_9VIRU|nr:MAG TPA: hypothetical protein [virus sp. ctrcb4]DAR12772.1 MAG TPA: hypothetical protein [Crassvirales sp.]
MHFPYLFTNYQKTFLFYFDDSPIDYFDYL